MITVVTATYGEDVPQEQPEQNVEADWVCVTDRPDAVCHPWRAVYEPRAHLTPRMAAHVVKCRPDRWGDRSATIILWVDASAQLRERDTVATLVLPLIESPTYVSVATTRHPDRRTIEEELPEAAGQGRYAEQMLAEQVRHYIADGYPDDRLYATTVMAYRRDATARALGNAWLLEQLRWTCQDQLSLPYVAWKTGIEIVTNEEHLWTTKHIALRPRARDV